MGIETPAEQRLLETVPILDFLYIDNERIDSFLSQINQGTLRSVTRSQGVSENSSRDAGVSVKLLKGGYKNERCSEQSIAEQIDPYHSKILTLLETLDLQTARELPADCVGQLMQLRGQIAIRDNATMLSMMSVFSKNIKSIAPKTDKSQRDVFNAAQDFLKGMPDIISLSLKIGDKVVSGTLKESGLTICKSDLMRTYGSTMPALWYVLGIIDTVSPNHAVTPTIANMEGVIDVCVAAVNQLYSPTKYRIIPLLIFRNVTN